MVGCQPARTWARLAADRVAGTCPAPTPLAESPPAPELAGDVLPTARRVLAAFGLELAPFPQQEFGLEGVEGPGGPPGAQSGGQDPGAICGAML